MTVPAPLVPELCDQEPPVSKVKVPELKVRLPTAWLLGPTYTEPGKPGKPSAIPLPPFTLTVPLTTVPSEMMATLPPPPPPPTLWR